MRRSTEIAYIVGYRGVGFFAIVWEEVFMVLEDFDWDMFDEDDDEVLECGLENPDICESCQ